MTGAPIAIVVEPCASDNWKQAKSVGKYCPDMKKHTSPELKVAIKSNSAESRKEWMNWMFERAGKKNGNNANWSRRLSGATT